METTVFLKTPLVSLIWLRRLRWCAFFGQAFIVFLVRQVFQMNLPLNSILALVAVTGLTNLLLYTPAIVKNISSKMIGSIMVFDIFLLSALLFFSGGPSNPFSIIYIIHVILAGVLLNPFWTWITAALSSLCFGALFFTNTEDSAMHMHNHSDPYSLHLYGMWIAFVIVAILVAYFLNKITNALKEQSAEIQRMQIASLHQERLAALTTLAAGAAHELGTPLATIALVASEIQRNIKHSNNPDNLNEDLILINSEVGRCKQILEQMSAKSGEPAGEMPITTNISELCKLLLDEFQPAEKENIQINNKIPEDTLIIPRRSFIQALRSLIENALEASRAGSKVLLNISEKNSLIQFEIEDHGCGIEPDILSRIGEPFFTQKEPGHGMGLGVFLARLVTQRIGGTLDFESVLNEGTTARLIVPRQI